MGRPSKYPDEFRREAVDLVRTSGRSMAEVARSLGISDATLGHWVAADREARARAADPRALDESERERRPNRFKELDRLASLSKEAS